MLRAEEPEDLLDAGLAPPEASDGLVAVTVQAEAGDTFEVAADGGVVLVQPVA
jgi:hypothetical protein